MAKTEISRRDFIKGLAASAVGVAAVGVFQAVDKMGGSTTSAADTATISVDLNSELGQDIQAMASGLTFTPGDYSASAKGFASDVTVKMTFDETMITGCEIDVSGETPSVGGKIGTEMAQKLLNAQSPDVDGVSGATFTSNAIKEAAADCISQASGQEVSVAEAAEEESSDWLGSAPEIAESEITETVDTECLVVGLGTGGWITAMTAGEEGMKTLAIEMNESPTGIREDIGAINSKLQQETIQTFPEQFIDTTEAVEDIIRYAGGYCMPDLIKVWAENSGEMVDWLTDLMVSTGDWYMSHEGSIGDTSDPERDKAYATGHSPHLTQQGTDNEVTTSSTFTDYCTAHGVEIRCSTKMVKLEQDANGKVTGIIAQENSEEGDHHYIRINASKGVIVCAGGYATNTQMMKALQPMTLEMKAGSTIGSKCDGSGIKAMLWAGGQMDPTHMSMMFNRNSVLPTETAGHETMGKWYWFGEQPFLKVNLNGQRFCNESGPYEFMLHSMYMQPHHTYCDIFDANNKQYCEQFQEVGCCRLFDFDNGAEPNRYYDVAWAGMVEGDTSHLAQGYLIKADTIEELAEGLNIPADNLVATVKRYNEMCAQGKDTDYFKAKHRLTPVDTAPFYGIRTCAWHLTTLDGVRINSDMQVLDADGMPIEGLYATGDCTGGFFAQTYPNLFTGLACGRTMTFGRRAAQNVAKR